MQTNPIYPHIDAALRLDDFVALSLEGFDYVRVGERVIDTIRKLVGSGSKAHPLGDDQVYARRKERYQKLAAFARAQQDLGFPYLFALAVVSLWATLEACVGEVISFAFRTSTDLAEFPHLARIKAPILSIISATPEERNEFLRDALQQEVASPLRAGVGQFEALLEAVQLSGTVAPSVRKALLELKETRNLILHRQGKVDARFMRQCPWVAAHIGSDLPLSHRKYKYLANAAFWYLIEVNERLRVRYREGEIQFDEVADDARSLQSELDIAVQEYQKQGDALPKNSLEPTPTEGENDD